MEGNSTAVKECEATTVVTATVEQNAEPLILHLREAAAEASDEPPRVSWSTDTVDNEGMGKKTSKCCCIYKKPKKWNESDSEDSDEEGETDHCHGHVEKKKRDNRPDDTHDCDCH